ncbi:MAG: 2'-5' RNA ligase family protein [Chloroflexota bacterium]
MRDQFTALSIPVEEAFFLQPFRERHISTPAAKKPPHVTVYSPFKAMKDVNEFVVRELAELILSFKQFPFSLKSIGRFPDIGVLYLSVEPVQPFQDLSHAIQEKYSELEPFISDPVRHVTLARVKDMDRVEEEFHLEYGNLLPIQTIAREVCLYEKRDSVWHKRNTFPLS